MGQIFKQPWNIFIINNSSDRLKKNMYLICHSAQRLHSKTKVREQAVERSVWSLTSALIHRSSVYKDQIKLTGSLNLCWGKTSQTDCTWCKFFVSSTSDPAGCVLVHCQEKNKLCFFVTEYAVNSNTSQKTAFKYWTARPPKRQQNKAPRSRSAVWINTELCCSPDMKLCSHTFPFFFFIDIYTTIYNSQYMWRLLQCMYIIILVYTPECYGCEDIKFIWSAFFLNLSRWQRGNALVCLIAIGAVL